MNVPLALGHQGLDVLRGVTSELSLGSFLELTNTLCMLRNSSAQPMVGTVQQVPDEKQPCAPTSQARDITTRELPDDVVIDNKRSVVLRLHQFSPNPETADAFPLRNPDNGSHVLPPYASDDDPTQCAPGVSIKRIAFSAGQQEMLRRLCHAEGMTSSQFHSSIAHLREAMKAELDRLLQGRALGEPYLSVRELQKDELPAHEQEALTGQYGAFVKHGTAQPPDKLTFLGLYGGEKVLASAYDQFQLTAPGRPAYEFGLTSTTLLAPRAFINPVGFANTALLPGADHKRGPEYDPARINASYVGFDVRLVDKDGKQRNERFIALVGLPRLYSDQTQPLGEVRVEYGPNYKEFEKQQIPVVKQESSEPDVPEPPSEPLEVRIPQTWRAPRIQSGQQRAFTTTTTGGQPTAPRLFQSGSRSAFRSISQPNVRHQPDPSLPPESKVPAHARWHHPVPPVQPDQKQAVVAPAGTPPEGTLVTLENRTTIRLDAEYFRATINGQTKAIPKWQWHALRECLHGKGYFTVKEYLACSNDPELGNRTWSQIRTNARSALIRGLLRKFPSLKGVKIYSQRNRKDISEACFFIEGGAGAARLPSMQRSRQGAIRDLVVDPSGAISFRVAGMHVQLPADATSQNIVVDNITRTMAPRLAGALRTCLLHEEVSAAELLHHTEGTDPPDESRRASLQMDLNLALQDVGLPNLFHRKRTNFHLKRR